MRFHAVIPGDSAAPALKGSALRAVACLAAALLTGCLFSPAGSPDGTATEGGPAARSQAGGKETILVCERVWSAAAGDSVWHCPDPAPPASP